MTRVRARVRFASHLPGPCRGSVPHSLVPASGLPGPCLGAELGGAGEGGASGSSESAIVSPPTPWSPSSKSGVLARSRRGFLAPVSFSLLPVPKCCSS